MKWLFWKWHDYWWQHYMDVYNKAYNNCKTTTIEGKINYHYEMYACYKEYFKGKKKMNREMRRLFKKYESSIDIEQKNWEDIPMLIKNPDLFTRKKSKNKKRGKK